MDVLRHELIEAQKTRSDLLKWKLIIVATVGGAALGFGGREPGSAHLALAVLPLACAYVDLLCRNLSLRNKAIGLFFERGGDADANARAYEVFYRKIHDHVWQRASLESWALRWSTLVISLAVAPVGILAGGESWIPWSWPAGLFYGAAVLGILLAFIVEQSYRAKMEGAIKYVDEDWPVTTREDGGGEKRTAPPQPLLSGSEGRSNMRQLSEKLVERWKASPYMALLEYARRLSVIVAVVTFVWEAPARHRQQVTEAWQVVYSAAGVGGGGVADAIRLLADRGISLAQVNINSVFLPNVELRGVDLRAASLWQGTFSGANLSRAKLFGAKLSEANFNTADLCEADLRAADLDEVTLSWALLDGADLRCVSRLTQVALDSACATTRIALPDGYSPPKADCSTIPSVIERRRACTSKASSWDDRPCGSRSK